MKKILIIVLIILTTPLLISCQTKQTIVPLLVYDMNDAYMQDFEQKIQNATTSDFDIITYDCQNSQIIQNEFLDNLLNDNYPVIIINPVDRLSVYAIIEKAKEVGTKIIFINREPLETDMNLYDSLYYVGADAKQSAELQAEIIMQLFGGNPYSLNQYDLNNDRKIQTVILKGEQGHQDAEARTKYVIDTLEANNFQVEVLDIKIANFDRQLAYVSMNELIEQYGTQIELVIANNDAMALGAIQSLKENNFFVDTDKNGVIDRLTEPWMPVVGIDGLDSAIQSINNGYLYGTVLNDSLNMAKAIVELSSILLFDSSFSNFDYTITDGKYIWIDYQKISIE